MCGEGSLKMNETIPQSACITDYCYKIDCGKGTCQATSNDYRCECDSG